MTEAARLLAALAARGWTIGAAESLTGGQVIAALIDVPGASAVVRGGVVAYATDLKARLLGVEEDLLERTGPVDPGVAGRMAEGARAVLGADVAVATTGVAGPDPQDGVAVGTVYVAVALPTEVTVESLRLAGSRDEIRRETTRRAVALCMRAVSAP